MITRGCSCRCMVSGALGITTDLQTLTSSFSNCGNRCVCVAPFCERRTLTAVKTKTMMTTRQTEIIFIPISQGILCNACSQDTSSWVSNPQTPGPKSPGPKLLDPNPWTQTIGPKPLDGCPTFATV